MKIYITRWALTKGIIEAEATLLGGGSVEVNNVDGPTLVLRGEGKDWHPTLAGAKQRADEMRRKKIASLKRQLEKYEKMSFI